MKEIQEVTACLWDYGTFLSLGERLAERMKKVYVYTPYEQEYLDLRDCVRGRGIPNVERLDEPLDPATLKKIDLFVFPDRGYGGVQRHLRDIGKAVWGSMGACELEEYRTKFLDTLKKLGLPVIHTIRVQGLTKLAEHLKTVKNKWVKIDRFRDNMETWKHIDFAHSQRKLECLAVTFGPWKEWVDFAVQDQIDPAIEIGYDGWFVAGEFPPESFQGYEKKNELYLGSKLKWNQLPDQVRQVNEAFAPVLREYGYANFWATELRLHEGQAYFIDPTARMPGQTGEQALETCENLDEVIWKGANGIMVPPKFVANNACEATLHYTAGGCDEWKSLTLPKDDLKWIKLYHYSMRDGAYHFLPGKVDEVGVILGVGDSIEESYEHLKTNLEKLKDEPVSAEIDGFMYLLGEVKQAEKNGLKFGNSPVPEAKVEEEKSGELEIVLVPAKSEESLQTAKSVLAKKRKPAKASRLSLSI